MQFNIDSKHTWKKPPKLCWIKFFYVIALFYALICLSRFCRITNTPIAWKDDKMIHFSLQTVQKQKTGDPNLAMLHCHLHLRSQWARPKVVSLKSVHSTNRMRWCRSQPNSALHSKSFTLTGPDKLRQQPNGVCGMSYTLLKVGMGGVNIQLSNIDRRTMVTTQSFQWYRVVCSRGIWYLLLYSELTVRSYLANR
jgi:hypothetical protein